MFEITFKFIELELTDSLQLLLLLKLLSKLVKFKLQDSILFKCLGLLFFEAFKILF
jgi:hypothetical protein